MVTGRLTFLYPHLYRTGGRWAETATVCAVTARTTRSGRSPPPATSLSSGCQHVARFTTPSVGRQAPFPKRAGVAIDPTPLPALETPQAPPDPYAPTDQTATTQGDKKDGQQQPDQAPPAAGQDGANSVDPTPPPEESLDIPPSEFGIPKGSSAMEAILLMPPPPSFGAPAVSYISDSNKDPPNHLTPTQEPGVDAKQPPPPPPYVHHFDTYSLVKQLCAGGYTLSQSITAMKAVRGILASNLDAAQESLLSKSEQENETYLFRAACSELSTEVRNNRRVADEQFRQQRALLQHEMDILTQRLNQEIMTLNDNAKGMFNDRRMAVREEQRVVDSRIQQILLNMSIILGGDVKAEIEMIRWTIVRRAIIGMVCLFIATFGGMKYMSNEKKKREKAAEELRIQREKELEESKMPNGKIDTMAAPVAAEILAAA